MKLDEGVMQERQKALESLTRRLESELADARAELERLRTGEERYRSLVEAVMAIVWNTPASGEFEVEQPGWGEFTGQSFAELKGWGWLEAVHPDDRPNTARVWSEAVASRRLYQVEHRLRRRDGAYRDMLVRAAPILAADGSIREWVGVHMDISIQKEAEKAWREAKALAEAANRAKSDFLANMSHEIRTPMNGIIGMTDLALGTALSAEQRSYLDLVKSSAEALLAIVNDILDFSKIEANRFELEAISFSLRDRVGDALKILAPKAHQKGLELVCRFDADVSDAVVGDPGRLAQVILNLVGNAIKFTARGEVAVHVRKLDASGCAEDGEPVQTVCFEIRDTGIGIAPEKRSRLFQPFSQADSSTTREYGGTGLGLSICKRLVELMGGTIDFESEPGVGSVFRFSARFAASARSSRQACAAPDRFRGLRVLVADGNASRRGMIAELAGTWGATAAAATSGEEALAAIDAAEAEGAPFGAVIADAGSTKIGGRTLVERLRERPVTRSAPVVVLSACDDGQGAQANRSADATVRLIKPVKPLELQEAIGALVQPAADWSGGPAPGGGDASRAAGETPLRRLRILLAEDNATNRFLAMELLRKAGHETLATTNGREAVEAYAAGEFDIVLMDVQMPELDGFAATAEVRKLEELRGAHTPIIAMTANAMKGDRERCLEAGMDGYISKPIRARELFDAIAEHASAGKPACAGAAIARSESYDKPALIARLGGREERLRRLIATFLDESSRQLIELETAAAEGDVERVRLLCHALKGAVGVFGAEELVAAFAAIERAADPVAAALCSLTGTQLAYQALKQRLESMQAL